MLKFLIIVAAAAAFVYYATPVFKRFAPNGGEPVACTMEAKICPDGSAVGRSGPKCEFAACPGE
jgi:hypothetical protein